jgi:hypothetical protein
LRRLRAGSTGSRTTRLIKALARRIYGVEDDPVL